MVELREITKDNYIQCMQLKCKPDQSQFVASNAFSLAQSKYDPQCIPLAIYKDNIMVGFIMHCIDADDDNHWIWRLMIDEKYQSQGTGTQAMKRVIQDISLDKTRHKILISFHPENKNAEKMYLKLGFQHTGDIIDDEIVMRLDY